MPKDKDEVGYKKPPKKTQFKKGQSGNPKGRPKGSKNKNDAHLPILLSEISQSFINAGQEPIPIIISGKMSEMKQIDAVFAKLYQIALSGHLKAIELVLSLTVESINKLDQESRNIINNLNRSRKKEREEIFKSPPKPGTNAEYYYKEHRFFSWNYCSRMVFGDERHPQVLPHEPRNEFEWQDYTQMMKDMIAINGDKKSNREMIDAPAYYDLY